MLTFRAVAEICAPHLILPRGQTRSCCAKVTSSWESAHGAKQVRAAVWDGLRPRFIRHLAETWFPSAAARRTRRRRLMRLDVVSAPGQPSLQGSAARLDQHEVTSRARILTRWCGRL